MSMGAGVVIGLITAINDNGMVKVKYPWLPNEPETDWIRIATTMAGNNRGTFFMPEKDDEVLIAFEHGDRNYPYVIGFLWNGKDRPPETSKDVRRIKTTSGHTIEFNDGNDRKIHIESEDKQVVELADKPGGGVITVRTKNGNVVEIDDSNGGNITINSTGTIGITAMRDANIVSTTGSLVVSSATGALTIDCLSATVTAKSSLTLAAPTVTCLGVLYVPTIMATTGQFGAVVSGVYNPGTVGTLIGL